MTAKWPDWRKVGDYEFTSELDRAGWAWEFLRRNSEYRAEYKSMMEQRSDRLKKTKFLHEKKDLVQEGPLTFTKNEELGHRWGMERAVDPDGEEVPRFRPVYPIRLDWDEVRGFYECSEPEAPITVVEPYSILVFDLDSDIDAQLKIARESLFRQSGNSESKALRRRKRLEWTTYLRLLDAGPKTKTPDIIKCIKTYQKYSNDVFDNYAATDKVSDHKKSAQALCDDPLSILGIEVNYLPRIDTSTIRGSHQLHCFAKVRISPTKRRVIGSGSRNPDEDEIHGAGNWSSFGERGIH